MEQVLDQTKALDDLLKLSYGLRGCLTITSAVAASPMGGTPYLMATHHIREGNTYVRGEALGELCASMSARLIEPNKLKANWDADAVATLFKVIREECGFKHISLRCDFYKEKGNIFLCEIRRTDGTYAVIGRARSHTAEVAMSKALDDAMKGKP